jgi:hypothetical protein
MSIPDDHMGPPRREKIVVMIAAGVIIVGIGIASFAVARRGGGSTRVAIRDTPSTKAPASRPSGDPGAGIVVGNQPPSSAAYRLSVLDVGDGSETTAFQADIDCIMASGIEGAETEDKVADTLYAGWLQSSQDVGLLEWANILCQF